MERRLRPDQGVRDGTRDFYREDWSTIQRANDRLLPCLQHALHLLPRVFIHQRVRIYKRTVQLVPKVDRIWRAHVFHDRV